jgi:hypothetical protein
MRSPIAELSESEQEELLEDLNYLNMSEIKSFCKEHSIPYSIWIETADAGRRRTKDDDRKGIVLGRIRHFLKTGEVLPATCFPASVACFDDPPGHFKPTDRLYYGQYDKTGSAMIGILKKLTDGKFRNGAVARILARDFWSKGIAPTFREFALAWLMASEAHTEPNPEWAFLADQSKGKASSDWKQIRESKAKDVLRVLNRLQIHL